MLGLLWAVAMVTGPLLAEVTELEPFVATAEVGPKAQEWQTESVDGLSRSWLETDRGVTVVGEQVLRDYRIDSVTRLARVVPGATVQNFYGLSGLPLSRGLHAAVYLNGLERAFNRSGFPTPLVGYERVEFIRGPSPVLYGAGLPGGVVNLVPKRPRLDEAFGEIRFSIGSSQLRQGEAEANVPLDTDLPAAIRLVLSQKDGGIYYRGIDQELTVVYGALLIQPKRWLEVFAGGQFLRFQGEELIGWNRVTQDLIDRGQYLSGPVRQDLTGPAVRLPDGSTVVNRTPGSVNRDALSRQIPMSLPSQASAEDRALYRFLGEIDPATADTVPISRKVSLRSGEDWAEADVYTVFFENRMDPGLEYDVTQRFLFDGYDREKYSTYGYAEKITNRTFEHQLLFRHQSLMDGRVRAVGGTSLRWVDARTLVDFSVEPFSRRDLTRGATPNDTVRTGPDTDDRGLPFWDPFGSVESQTWLGGVFSAVEAELTRQWTVTGSARWDHASWRRGIPSQVPGSDGSRRIGGGKSMNSLGIGTGWKPVEVVSLFANWQRSTTFQGYLLGGVTDRGDTNFQEMDLWEMGVKLALPERGLQAGATFFYQDLTDFDERGGGAIPQRGRGVELEMIYEPTAAWSFLSNLTWQQHWYRSGRLPAGFIPLSADEMRLYGGGSTFAFDGGNNSGRRYAVPEVTANLLGRYQHPNGWGIAGGPSFLSSVDGNPQRTLRLPSVWLWNASIFRDTGSWRWEFRVENLTDQTYFFASEEFSANTILLPQPGRQWFLSVARRF